jgi:sulfide dehydrogenase cytochrome subunit
MCDSRIPPMQAARSIVCAAALLAASAPPFSPALAQTVNLNVAAKAASCNACHGPYGRSDAGIPPLAGRSVDELYTLLLSFKTGTREAFVMHQHAKGYSEQELRDIAAEFSRQSATQGRK